MHVFVCICVCGKGGVNWNPLKTNKRFAYNKVIQTSLPTFTLDVTVRVLKQISHSSHSHGPLCIHNNIVSFSLQLWIHPAKKTVMTPQLLLVPLSTTSASWFWCLCCSLLLSSDWEQGQHEDRKPNLNMIKSMSTSADLPATQKPFQESSTHAQDLSRNWWGLKKKKWAVWGSLLWWCSALQMFVGQSRVSTVPSYGK